MLDRYDFSSIEKKWQKKWEEEDAFKVTEDESKEKNIMYLRCSRTLQANCIWVM